MSNPSSGEHRSLLGTPKKERMDNDQLMSTLRYSATSGNVTVQRGDTHARDGADKADRHSTMSAEGLENASLLGSVVQPQDLTELMGNLERATMLVKRYLTDNQGVQFGKRTATRRPLIPRLITNYLLVITFLWQAINIGLIEGIDRLEKTDNSSTTDHARTAKKGWDNVVDKVIRKDVRSDSSIIATLLFLRMLYFSISTGTLCGTSAIEPLAWYGGLTVSCQMLMSFVYFASILSLGLRVFTQGSSNHHVRSLTKKIRECVFREKASVEVTA